MFNRLEGLKTEIPGTYSTISFIRPYGEWVDLKNTSSFYVGICRTPGDKQHLSEKLCTIIKQFTERLLKNFED